MSVTREFLVMVFSPKRGEADPYKVSRVPGQRQFVPGKIVVPVLLPRVNNGPEDSFPELD